MASISTRTPEGFPGSCPVCGARVVVDPSRPYGDAPCPACGTLLWFVQFGEDLWLFDRRRIDVANAERIARLLDDENRDSIDMAELLMELEDLGEPDSEV